MPVDERRKSLFRVLFRIFPQQFKVARCHLQGYIVANGQNPTKFNALVRGQQHRKLDRDRAIASYKGVSGRQGANQWKKFCSTPRELDAILQPTRCGNREIPPAD
ncbi:MAG TPA: hypothetical protein VFC07_07775 [Verrucomicrobiae bacterium]|nr:hypothetical protein [Verrucomicrobiae bacterium]